MTTGENPADAPMTARTRRARAWAARVAFDLRFALRAVTARSTGSTLLVLTLALVMGLTAGCFCLYFNGRYRIHDAQAPDRLISIDPIASSWLGDLERLPSLAAVGAAGGTRMVLDSQNDPPQQIAAGLVTPGWLSAVRPHIVLGRGFEPADYVGDSPQVMIISAALWSSVFAHSRDVLGKTLNLRGPIRPRIVGVMSDGFAAPRYRGRASDLWLPMMEQPLPQGNERREGVARLVEGASLSRAAGEIRELLRSYRQRPGAMAGVGMVHVQDFETFGWSKQQHALFAIWMASMFLLLVASANAGMFLLGRALDRRREHAITRAVGASPGQLVRQGLFVGSVLALGGAVMGQPVMHLFIWILSKSSVAAVLFGPNPGVRHAQFDLPTAAYLGLATIVTAVAVSLPAAMEVTRTPIQTALKGSARTHSGGVGARRWREVLLAFQIAVVIALFAMSQGIGTDVAPGADDVGGFNFDDVAYLRVDYEHPDLAEGHNLFASRMLTRLARLPKVEAAALAFPEPLADELDQAPPSEFLIRSTTPGMADGRGQSLRRTVGGDFLKVLRVPLRRGRWLSADGSRKETVIDETFAARFFPGQDPVGRKLRPLGMDFDFTIVGVVGKVMHRLSDDEFVPTYYLSYQDHPEPSATFLVRAAVRDTSQAMAGVVHAVDSQQAIASSGKYLFLILEHGSSMFTQVLIVGAWAWLAMLIAMVGLAGSAQAMVAARTNEIGLRAAIGSSPGRILALVIGQTLRPCAIGALLGALLTLLTHHSEGFRALMLLDVPPVSLTDFALVVRDVGLLALLAVAIPALRAARLRPHSALRYE
jgi:predicted permease